MIRRLFSGRLRESWVHCGILTLFLAVVILVVHLVYPDSVYGSQTDWSNQHFAIPEYFRTRFYATGELSRILHCIWAADRTSTTSHIMGCTIRFNCSPTAFPM